MKKLCTYALCALVLLLPGCGMLTPQQRESARTSIDQAHMNGQMTDAQHDAAIEALDNDGGVDWETLLTAGGSIIGSILLGVPIAVGVTNKKRGPTEAQRLAAKSANKPA